MAVPYANVTAFEKIGDLASLGTTVLTKMAMVFEQFPGDPISPLFPMTTSMNTSVFIERVREGVGIAPLVIPGQADVLTDNPQVERMQVFPAYVRESDFVPMNVINDLRKVGTLNEREGREFVARRIQRMTNRNNHLFAILRAQMLLGGIKYTDPRTKVPIDVPSNIPSSNLFDIPGLGQTGWADTTNALPVTLLQRFRRRIFDIAKVEPTMLIMNSNLQTIIEQNAEVLRRQESAFWQTGWVQFKEGKLVEIAGMKVVTVDHVFQNPANSYAVEKVWPINKVAMLAEKHPSFSGQVVGHQVHCVGEDPMGRPGLWVRSGPDTQPPAAPGRSMQLGNAGIPYLQYPEWVSILTVDTVNNLTAKSDPSVTNPF